MNNIIIEKYNAQYKVEGSCWNKESCLNNGKIETYSGPGSLLENTDLLIENLNKFIKNNNIKSIIDVPCGDFNYMSKLDLDNIQYLGLDISINAIDICKSKIQKSNIQFNVFDITNENLQYSDLILIKDLFIHLSFSDIKKILDNIKSSKCKYFAVSRYNKGYEPNKDQDSGLCARSIEITKEPFNFNYPIIFTTNYSSKEWLKDEIIIFKLN